VDTHPKRQRDNAQTIKSLRQVRMSLALRVSVFQVFSGAKPGKSNKSQLENLPFRGIRVVSETWKIRLKSRF